MAYLAYSILTNKTVANVKGFTTIVYVCSPLNLTLFDSEICRNPDKHEHLRKNSILKLYSWALLQEIAQLFGDFALSTTAALKNSSSPFVIRVRCVKHNMAALTVRREEKGSVAHIHLSISVFHFFRRCRR